MEVIRLCILIVDVWLLLHLQADILSDQMICSLLVEGLDLFLRVLRHSE